MPHQIVVHQLAPVGHAGLLTRQPDFLPNRLRQYIVLAAIRQSCRLKAGFSSFSDYFKEVYNFEIKSTGGRARCIESVPWRNRIRKDVPATGVEYRSTLSKWKEWNKEVPIESIGRPEVREFLDWVNDCATESKGGNPGRTANKCREHLRAVLSWAWEQELIDTLPKFPQTKKQRDVAGRHYLTKAELNALYFATYMMPPPRGCHLQFDIGSGGMMANALAAEDSFDGATGLGDRSGRAFTRTEPVSWWLVC